MPASGGDGRGWTALPDVSEPRQRDAGAAAVRAPGTGGPGAQQRVATVTSTRLPFSLTRAVQMRFAFLGRVCEAFGRLRRHREMNARIAASEARVPGSDAHVTHRLHRCPWCGTQAAYLFSYEVAYPDKGVLSERWLCAHCGGDHTRKV